MFWPSQSFDLNPIENIWAIISCGLAEKTFTNKEKLWEAVKNEWNNIYSSVSAIGSLSLFGRALQVKHKQDWSPGFIYILPQAAVLPGSDVGSDGVKPASRKNSPFQGTLPTTLKEPLFSSCTLKISCKQHERSSLYGSAV